MTPYGWTAVHFHTDELEALRAILSQTAAPNSLQAGLINRIGAAIEEAERRKYGRAALFTETERGDWGEAKLPKETLQERSNT